MTTCPFLTGILLTVVLALPWPATAQSAGPDEGAEKSLAPVTLDRRTLLDEFNEYGVQIITPSYESDPAEPKIVPKSKWFEAPAKRQP